MRSTHDHIAIAGAIVAAVLCLTPVWKSLTGEEQVTDGTHTWSFEKEEPGALPAGWKAETTGQKEPQATWQVIEDGSAPSGDRVLALTSHKRQSWARDLCWTDAVPFLEGEIEVRSKAVGGTGIERGGGVVWRVQDKTNYYGVRTNYEVGRPGPNSVGLYCTINGERVWKAYAHDVGLAVGKWHNLRVIHRGDVIQVYLDGRKLLEETHSNSPLTTPGGVGVWTKGDAVTSFDDLRVTLRDAQAEGAK